ncbi:MAG: hypothetical protein AB7K04_07670 [Pseudorhodoplanes sp.]
MRKSALLLAVLMAASVPTMALAAKKKAPAPAKYSTTKENSNESSARIVRDGLSQFFVPMQTLAQAPKAAEPAKKAKKSKKKAKKKK